jgi:hypothetical protein
MRQAAPGRAFGRAMRLCFVFGLWIAVEATAAGDATPATGQAPPAAAALDRTLASLHGIVLNAATGGPVPRALVRIEGDAAAGALTDGEGRFEIPGVPVGPQAIEVLKPGFRDRPRGGAAGADAGASAAPAHNIMVAAQMGDLIFTLAPNCAIRGQIQLSTGDPAVEIEVSLVRRTIQDGRAVWEASGYTKSRSDGSFRFAGLGDGVYALYSQPVLDGDLESTPGPAGAGRHWGYASVFYPDARDPSGAAKISVANGEEAQVTLTLTREVFQPVTATAIQPQAAAESREGMNYSAVVMDGAGHQLPYGAQYDEGSHTIQALLPDGSYSLLVSTVQQGRPNRFRSLAAGPDSGMMAGVAEFSVAGHAVTNLRVPLVVPHAPPVETTVERSAQPTAGNEKGMVLVMLSQAGGWIDNGMVGTLASGSAPGPLEGTFALPGSYWVHTRVAQNGLCEASFTAGGANLAREPVIVALSGSTAPMELTLRDDCARLTLSLPDSLAAIAPGEESYYTVYVVPDFDFTGDLSPTTLRASTGGTVTLENLTPGSYRVYTFDGPLALEYRNPAALAALPTPGQAVTLAPGSTGNLVLEAPQP